MNLLTKERGLAYLQLARIDKPIGTLLLLWPTLWALWLAAGGLPNLWVLTVFVVGVFLMRSAGCVINDYADRNFDGHVKRTSGRPLPTGKVDPREALALFFVLALISFGLVLTLNSLTIAMSFVGLLLAVSYPFMKRFIPIPQLVLGMAFSWSIPMAYAAQANALPAVAWLVFIANLLWTVAYDTQYAMVDRDDDLKLGLKSSAILFGRHDKRIIGVLQLATLLILLLVGQLMALGSSYYWGLLGAAVLFVYQQRLIRERQREACFQAFLNNNYVGALVFAGLVLDYLLG
ncbi:4-hydroxybenzoate octaprenyltransferase [Aeromonas enteropelogenes]|uniref:4-hydroxybenzoate octaprenyltransferase n=1 Tax=Aeromonas TaxID=642 RepID=UPI00191EFEC1|nr:MULTISPECIES: 4-hydroxybenzoate octaprenyltransferase [Aeromonas]MBL0459064.1 4-hydroxybenzoate octaprenyltransferase [Aeromonas enteropelogenes]QXC34998.1 4-hydroxybenzoate octaprenyltransferase [Aeromonas sp. FDAARGOS 1407]UAK72313.1 4-hydroxybenzoate octaprenyltransferase [Aeromonas enteropelogenes]UBH28050.1 4-hydroxybenzoate octaprenyltransferase [Aeromonas enteropelogenes]UCA11723.1 4-hydroxybenzoate octaprenyltransferase [Aeromonas enteropelogenes]